MRQDRRDMRLLGAPDPLDGLELLGALLVVLCITGSGLLMIAWRLA